MQFLHQRGQAARIIKVLHKVFTGWLQVSQQGYILEVVKIIHPEVNAYACGDGQQVDHKIGGTADGRVNGYGIFECDAGENIRKL